MCVFNLMIPIDIFAPMLMIWLSLQAIYDRAFTWIVSRINKATEVTPDSTHVSKNTVIGVLDIYGFEIFDNNR